MWYFTLSMKATDVVYSSSKKLLSVLKYNFADEVENFFNSTGLNNDNTTKNNNSLDTFSHMNTVE